MTGVAPRSEAIAKYATVDVTRMIEAMLWNRRVPRGRCENIHQYMVCSFKTAKVNLQ